MSSRRAREGARGSGSSTRSPAIPHPLPSNIRDALQRLPKAVEPLSRPQPKQGDDGSGSPLARLRTTELRAILQHVVALQDFLFTTHDSDVPRASADVLAHAPARQALLRLLAVSLRLRRHELSGESGSRQELCAKIAEGVATTLFCTLMPVGASTDHPGRSLRLPLLRSGALHAAARQLAELVEPLAAGAAATAAGAVTAATAGVGSAAAVEAVQGPVGRPTAAEGQGALTEPVVAYAGSLLVLVYVVIISGADPGLVSGTAEALRTCGELVAALEDSQVLEHAGQALLLLQLHAPGQRGARPLDQATLDANWAHQGLWQMVNFLGERADGQGTSASDGRWQLAASLRAVASGRCAQHAALCLGLPVLCDADGGPAYGMPPELLAALPMELGASPSGRRMGAFAIRRLRGMLAMLQLRLGTQGPPGRRGALGITMRAGWLAVASARALAAEKGSSGGHNSGGRCSGNSGGELEPPRRIVPAPAVFSVALQALQAAQRHLLLETRPEAEGAVAEAAGWWRLVAVVAADVLPHGTLAAELKAFGDLLIVSEWESAVDDGVLSLPPEAPLDTAAALEGGLLRCLERLLRRAGRDPQGPESVVVVRALRGLADGSLWPFVARLLAYGEPRQAAALVATLRKLLRTGDPQTMVPDPGAEWSIHLRFLWAWGYVLHAGVDWALAEPWEAELLEREEGEAAAPGSGPSPASQQLLRLLSCAACEWLPELSRTAMAVTHRDLTTLHTMMRWLPLLAARCASRPCEPAGSASASGQDGGQHDCQAAADDDCGDGGGWRALLLEDLSPVPLLSVALQAVPSLDKTDGGEFTQAFLRDLVLSCCAVAAVYTGQAPAPASAAAADHAQGATVGPAGTAGPSGATSLPPLPWQAELLREAATGLRNGGQRELAADAEGLAASLERGGGGTFCVALQRCPLASALLPPAEARRRLLPCRCANPACANLEGDSEADLRLKACARCGAVGYCCRPCQLEHWRAGHKEVCGRLRGGGE
ncbi:hypothetical protein GPECTOR_22g875 [Gonium pectorale]|uniref:phytol kinase n=1 Tax=Gonium pectorale TaxID=33097 RepID=A0A150GHF7_GONPE|nr:hypothetical protein GPECTOR_22g875 [Gonium pectorale]|eukprot:KXZ49281.1 hypothetical protein GPECTOR_22g875 [Gonium pectorale]